MGESIPMDADLALLLGTRPSIRFYDGDELNDGLDAPPNQVLLLTEGSAQLCAETPFGPHPVATLRPPTLLNLIKALAGSSGVCRARLSEGGAGVFFTDDEARARLADPGPEGQAFRRLALASVTTALRDTNASLTEFFDVAEKKKSGAHLAVRETPKAGTERPADPALVYDLFDAAGLNPSGLPDLGLVARTLDGGTPLVLSGTRGDEAYLIASGRLRVSIRIPGVGEEALAILGVGEIVGEMSLIDDAPRSADVYAHEGPATVYVLSRTVLKRLLDSGETGGAPLLAGITVVLARRHEEAIRKAAGFRVLVGPF
jgi:hypothetical protein